MAQTISVIRTLVGAICLLIGIAFIVLPGPAIIFIPAGLLLLSEQFPIAEQWLKQYMRYTRKAANQTDRMIKNAKQRWLQRKWV
ncbi:PGPGW domain-containing protein [Thalassotalea maritima]|uniref:PGPGW domain-containing protein n=1 Tax=Thalassotalea maritima TaxID=3242416 RepID=UPI0035292B61